MADKTNRIKYLLGIDGGGTKTEFLLTDLNKKEINRVVLGASNPNSIGTEKTAEILRSGILQVCNNKDLSEVSVFAGIAGGMSSKNHSAINDLLSDMGFGAYSNGSDVDCAIQTTLKGENGITVIMGTGMVAFSVCDGIRHRIGGWGYMIDKGGSGFNFGSDALNSALSYIDGRGGSKTIFKLIEEKTQKPLVESITEIYNGGASHIASFAPIVFDAYKSGDKEAEKIIFSNTKEIAQLISTGYGFLTDAKGKAVICGGLNKQKDILEPFISSHLGDNLKFEFSDEPMVNGAIYFAQQGGFKC